MFGKRRQASLFLHEVPLIEGLRWKFNPNQAALIPPHVTLIREDEVLDWKKLGNQLSMLGKWELMLGFGKPIWHDGLVYLPVSESRSTAVSLTFDSLRAKLLVGQSEDDLTHAPRKHVPHLTLIHPRNGLCTDSIFAEIQQSLVEFEYCFREVVLIEQSDGGPWRVLSSDQL